MRHADKTTTKKAALRLPWCRVLLNASGGFAGTVAEFLAEFFDATRFDNTLLRTSKEWVRFGSGVALEQRVGLAIDLDGFAALQRGAGNKLEAIAHVLKHDFAVIGMYVFFHFINPV
jgi:hypothetical protein